MFEVVERGARRFDDVAAAVVPPVLLQTETPARARNHLPEARSPAVRVGERVVGTLDNWQQREFEGQVAPDQLVGDVRQVTLCPCEHARQVVRMADKPVQFGLNSSIFLALEPESVPQARQQVI